MESDSLFEEMEPRLLRPLLPLLPHSDMRMQAQVSEPSLFDRDVQTRFKDVSNPRMGICETSPVKSPGFIPQLTPLSALRGTLRRSCESCFKSSCSCGSPSLQNASTASPSFDMEIKTLIKDQNRQLQLLHKQVEQLLQYQERLHDREENSRERVHGSTQTSFLDAESPVLNRSRPLANTGNFSPVMRHQPQHDRAEITLTFRDLQLETIVEQPPSPQPSFVVNMHEYPESVSERCEESIDDSCVDVMEQVQRLLAQANVVDTKRQSIDKTSKERTPLQTIPENPVRKVTMQRVQELGISFITPGISSSNYYPRCNSKVSHLWESRKETDQSVEMQRLAEKYLGQPRPYQTKTYDRPQKQLRPVEMSLSSQQYLERYGLREYPDRPDGQD